MFSLNRIVAFLTPLVFAPAAAVITGWVAKHFPGLPAIDSGQVVALEIAGATFAFGTAASWLHGHQKWNQIIADLIHDGNLGNAVYVGFVKAKAVDKPAAPAATEAVEPLPAPSTTIADIALPAEATVVVPPAPPADSHA